VDDEGRGKVWQSSQNTTDACEGGAMRYDNSSNIKIQKVLISHMVLHMGHHMRCPYEKPYVEIEIEIKLEIKI
jgi:hypothetical protein